jgi:hypothetical protein
MARTPAIPDYWLIIGQLSAGTSWREIGFGIKVHKSVTGK